MNDNYPMGANDDPQAPWKQEEPKAMKVDCSVCYCMSKSMPVNVPDHTKEDPKFNDTNFIEEFKHDNSVLGLPDLLEELQKLCKEKINILNIDLDYDQWNREYINKELKHYLSVLNSTKDWVVDDLDVVKE